MFLLPYEHFTIRSTLQAQEAVRKLEQVIEPVRYFRPWWASADAHKDYQGTLSGNSFSVTRIIHYRNSFLPVIEGKIEPEMGGCSIEIHMHPHWSVIVFMVFWLGGTGSLFLEWLPQVLNTLLSGGTLTGDMLPMLFAPGSMFLFGCAMLIIPFKIEARESKAYFRHLLQDALLLEKGPGSAWDW